MLSVLLYIIFLDNPYHKIDLFFEFTSSLRQENPLSPTRKAPKEEQEHINWLNFNVDNVENSKISSASDYNLTLF
jgi:hypothetical protein